MQNFIYNIPTKVFFGKGQISNLSAAIKEYGASKVLLVYGGGSIKKYGVYEAATAELKKENIKFVEIGNVKPNPHIEDVNEAIKTYKDNGFDFILGIGGGSTIDSCKAIAAGVHYDGSVLDFMTGKAEMKKIYHNLILAR